MEAKEIIWHFNCGNEFPVENAREFYKKPKCPYCDSTERFYKVSSLSFRYAYDEKQRSKLK